jgi:two-component system, NarL family, invasion response regulator UvrY
MASVLIADDHAMIRAGLRHYLEQDRSLRTIGETSTAAETLRQLSSAHWDLVILDINMPDRSGLDVLRDIRARHPATIVLMMSVFAEKQYAVNVLRAGAAGYLAKDKAPEEFSRAVRTVLAGRRFISTTLSEVLDSAPEESSGEPLHAVLSQREFQILCKLAVGRSVTEIAHELSLSVKTVSTYRMRLLEKMHLDTNADLTTYALRNGLVH